ncbi:MAG: hypothetical protein H8E98_05875 [Bacteroidetes bacterium]|nr:hypothetical protein [Bacteroidota bacterium]
MTNQENITYFEWNELLTNYFFKNEFNNQLVFLCITKRDIDNLGKEEFGADNGSIHFINQIIEGPEFFNAKSGIISNALDLSPSNLPVIADLLKRDKGNLAKYFEEYPPYLSYLVFFSLAEMEVINAGAHAYYEKVFSLIKYCFKGTSEELNKLFPLNPSQQSNQMASLGLLWKELEKWSQRNKKGDFVVYRGNYQSHASKARVNAILNYSERTNIYQLLRSDYDKELLPSILDVVPAIQRCSAPNSKYFRADLIYSDSQTASYEKLIQNAIYNIVINDIKNDFSTQKGPQSESYPNIIGFIREKNFPFKSTVSHFSPDTYEEIDHVKNKMVIENWINGGHISIESRKYNIKKGIIKIFTKNKKSFEISGNPFRQVNRIIKNGGIYIIGVNISINVIEFEEWLKRQDNDNNELETDCPKNWKFYKVKNLTESFKPLGITIHDNTHDSFSREQPQIELLHGMKITNRVYLTINPPDIILTNFHTHFLNKTYDLTAKAIEKSTSDNIITDLEVKIEPFEDYHELAINLNQLGFETEIEISLTLFKDNESIMLSENFKVVKGTLSKSAWSLSESKSGFEFDYIDDEIKNDVISYLDNPSIDINEKNSNEILKDLDIFKDIDDKNNEVSTSYLSEKLKLIIKDINDLWEVM